LPFSESAVTDLGISNATYKTVVIGSSGGDITLEGGVKLSVPPNALSEKIEVSLGVTFSLEHSPQVRKLTSFCSHAWFLHGRLLG